MTPSRAWAGLLAVAGVFAAIAISQWIGALASGRPVLYGEGAVANAALLLREGNPYLDTTGAVAANYPPLYLWLASLADPFRGGRLVTIASALAIGVIVWWRAWPAAPVPRAALAFSWLALTPVAIWGAAVKPDLFAIALTVAGVAAVDHAIRPALGRRDVGRWLVIAGALLGAAVWAKPTALLAAAAMLAYLFVFARPAFLRAVTGAALVGAFALAHAYTLGIADVWRHVVTWNALPWSAEQALLLLVLGAAAIGILVIVAARSAAFTGPALAYALGAAGVVLLGGREGATINYLLDLAAATVYALATVAPRIAASASLPLAAAAQIVLGFALVAPFGLLPGREAGTGAWGSADRLGVIRLLPAGEAHLVEDSGLLIAAGMRPVVDDLFLWSRLASSGLVDPSHVVDRVRRGELATIVSEVDLERIDEAAAVARSRWHPLLVDAVLERYEPSRRIAGVRLWTYRPR